jgi:hypothetical protein
MRIAVLVSFTALALSTSAHAQTSSQIAARKPAETYSYLKRTLERLGVGADAVAERGHQSDGSISLSDCVDVSWYIGDPADGHGDSILQKTANLAYDLVYMQSALQAAGYPKSLWERDLSEYERINLEHIDSYRLLSTEVNPRRQRIVDKLTTYRNSVDRKPKTMSPSHEGCGGGEVEVIIRTAPRARRVQYINLVKYDLCGFQGLDPNGSLCDHWTDYGLESGQGAQMAGKYKLRITWSDGSTDLRNLNVDDLPPGRDVLDPKTFSIRK